MTLILHGNSNRNVSNQQQKNRESGKLRPRLIIDHINQRQHRHHQIKPKLFDEKTTQNSSFDIRNYNIQSIDNFKIKVFDQIISLGANLGGRFRRVSQKNGRSCECRLSRFNDRLRPSRAGNCLARLVTPSMQLHNSLPVSLAILLLLFFHLFEVFGRVCVPQLQILSLPPIG